MVTVRELSTGREFDTHHDRLSNPLFSGNTGGPELEPEHDVNANFKENLKEPKENLDSVGDSENAPMRTRSNSRAFS